ncbi:MAG TPA: nucleotidyltransferase family protein [Polyangia bacterium]|jgi:hypothetical protein
MTPTSREWDALLACARAAVWDRRPAGLDLGGVAAAALIALADDHGLIPHLHRVLGDVIEPAAARADLARRARQIALQNLHFTGELHRVHAALARAGIEAVVLKGPALAVALYGSVGLRQFTDLDLLVPRAHAERAVELLVALGYRGTPPPGRDDAPASAARGDRPPAPGRAEQRSVHEIRRLHEVRLFHLGRRVAVEIHRALVPGWLGKLQDLDGCRERARPLVVGGRPVLDLADEDKILHLAVHGSGHAWARLQWLCDLGRLIHTGAGIRWPEVAARARAVGCERDLALALALARDLLGVEPPLALRGDAASRAVTLVLRRYAARRARTRAGVSPSRLTRNTLQLVLRERARDRVLVLASVLFNPTAEDLELLRLPPSLWPVAAALRPLSLCHRYLVRPALARAFGRVRRAGPGAGAG